MSKATFPDKLRTQMRMALPMIDRNIRCRANTSRQSLMQASGLNDNQLQAALRMAYGEKGVPSPVYRSPTAGKMYDSESLLRVLAKWCGMWAYVIED